MIPPELLKRLAEDPRVPPSSRDSFTRTWRLDEKWRLERNRHAAAEQSVGPISSSPQAIIGDCGGSEILPGTIIDPSSTTDPTVLRAYTYTTHLLTFFRACFSRNSIDDAGKDLLSSIHFSKIYSNAYWSSELLQMVYGDGDGLMLLDFTRSPEFIGHEVVHGLTQFTAKLKYENECGALNESVSDTFGSMFAQWLGDQEVRQAHWKIGVDLIGPTAQSLGYRCVRDLADPGALHSMTRQPSSYDDFIPNGDPHDNSGIPNHAFYRAAQSIGGRSWEVIGPVWYATLTDPRAHEEMTFAEFGRFSVENAALLFPGEPAVARSVAAAWQDVKVQI